MSTSDQPKIRGALVGCGYFGRIQLEAWRRMPDVEIVAACDPIADRARECAPGAYSNLAAMLGSETLDFVDIATRPDTHLDLVRQAVGHGLACICQKPMASTLEEAREIVALAQSSGVRVMIHENWRWQPWYRQAKQLLSRGDIGAPVAYALRIRQGDGLGSNPYPNQPYFREMPRLLIHETLIHPIDTARFLFGEITTAMAHSRRYNPAIRGEDRALLILVHESGLDGIVDGHRFLDPDPPGPAMGCATIEGEKGYIRVLANGEVYRNTTLVGAYKVTAGYKGDSVRATQRHFIDGLRNGHPFETSAEAYLPSFATVEAAYRSIAERRVVALQELLS